MSDTPAPYPHWMLREIHEQPDTLAQTLAALVADSAFLPAETAPLRAWLEAAGN